MHYKKENVKLKQESHYVANAVKLLRIPVSTKVCTLKINYKEVLLFTFATHC